MASDAGSLAGGAMIRTMHGFGSGSASVNGDALDIAVRSANHKFCEVKVVLPRELLTLEHEVVRAVKERIARGGVEVVVRKASVGAHLSARVDVSLAEAYARAFAELQSRLGLSGRLRLKDVLAAEGVIRLDGRSIDLKSIGDALRRALAEALGQLEAMRNHEGELLARELERRLGRLEGLSEQVADMVPRSVEQFRARLLERMERFAGGGGVDGVRLGQEVAAFADRVDVAEEITRLRSHVAQVRALIAVREPAGRKLDFLVQEMHREVHTMGSKSQSAEIAAAVVVLKAEIEELRELVQDVE